MKHSIKQGHHVSYPRIPELWCCKDEHKFTFTFSKTMWHREQDIPIQGINKVCGVSFGIHAEDPFGKCALTKWFVNSIVIGWRPNYKFQDAFELYIVNDNKGVETRTKYFDNIYVGQTVNVTIKKVNKGMMLVKINKIAITVLLNTLNFGYYLGFYFGGKSTAPHDMYVDLITGDHA